MKKQTTLTHEEIQNGTHVAWVQDENYFSYHENNLSIYYFHQHGGKDLNGMELKENLVCWENPGMVYIYPETKGDALKRINDILDNILG